jgi:molybdopterin-guanine dinucleotide biosynthesis protein MobB
MTIPIVSIIGWHNSGKTTLIEHLLRELKERGYRVATVKHSGGHFDMDRPGTDTWRYAEAGSDLVAIVGGGHSAILEQFSSEPSLETILARLPQDLDLVITEGYKRAPTPKIRVYGESEGAATPMDAAGELLATVSATGHGAPTTCEVPHYAAQDVTGVIQLLIDRAILSPTPRTAKQRPAAD